MEGLKNGMNSPGSITARTTFPRDFGPFMPGTGCLPPYLAGREQEQAEVEGFLSLLEQGFAPPSALIFFGPRGNGKTALLNWTRRQALDLGIRVINFGTADVHTEESLINQLTPDSWWTGFVEVVSWRSAGARSRKSGASSATRALARLAGRAPTILLIDEAHTLDTEIGRQLLVGAQSVALEDAPLLLCLAGTPDLPRHLRKMRAAFWERSAIAPVQRLDPDASSEAIRIPLEAAGKEITPHALTSVVAESHGYPYFLQRWGKQLWDEVHHTSRPIGMEDVDRVRPKFESKRKRFYSQRYRELDDGGLLGPAVALAEAYEGIESLDSETVNEVLVSALEAEGRTAAPEEVRQVREGLHDLGYIWSPLVETGDPYLSGIPSLMSFVCKTRRSPDPRSRR